MIGLSKTYGGIKAVDDLNLVVPPGELFGFIGPNGAGKTTTIRMIGGLLAPTSGTVIIDGINMAVDPVSAKKRIGVIPDRPYLYEKLTGWEFMRFTADLYDVPETVFTDRGAQLLQQFGLDHRADELVESYSHGMKQRLIMAAALLHQPKLLIIDEPMVGLDPRGIRMVRQLFRQLVDDGTTIFMSTHTLSLAESVCDRIGIINDGCLIATGSISELKRRARRDDADLEQAFLDLTQQQQAI